MRWVIGDVHGMLRPLRALVSEIETRDSSLPEFWFVGDYVNRGPESRGVIDFLLGLKRARFCRGNHDDVLDMILNGESYCQHPDAQNPVAAFMWFIHFGLWE